jgi:acetoacetate decarboxylase
MFKKFTVHLFVSFIILFVFNSFCIGQNIEKGYAMPSVAPLYTAPPVQFQDNKIIRIFFKTTPELLQELVPKPLAPNQDNLMFIYVGELNIVDMVSYKEVGIGVPVSFSEKPGNYAVYLYLDKAVPIVGGREIWGFPKKDAEITFEKEDNKISAKIVREGAELINASLNVLEKVDPIPSRPNLPWFNLKIIPSVKKGAPPDVKQITSTLLEYNVKELHRGMAKLEFGTSPLDPLGNIKVVEIIGGEYVINDFVLGYGDILHDYLTEEKKE